MIMAVLLIFPVILRTVINAIMLSIGKPRDYTPDEQHKTI